MTVAGLWRYAVKSMEGERLESVAVGPTGVPGDRGWALRERGSGRPLSAKRHAALMLCRAQYLDEPRAGEAPPPVEVVLPDGSRARTDDPRSAALLSRLLGVDCAFGREDDGAGHFDARPLHLLTESALRALESSSGLRCPVERFRPNLLVAGAPAGRPEDGWRRARIGAVELEIVKPVKRCVMTTLPQPGLPAEPDMLRAVVAQGATLGVYARALRTGVWRAGDPCAIIADA